MLTVLEKIAFLQDNGVAQWDTSMINPNRLKFLAQIGRTANNQALQRYAKKRRYPILLAFLKQGLQTLTDDVIEMYDQCLWDCYTDAKKELKELQQRAARTINEKQRLFRRVSEVLLDPDVADDKVREHSFRRIPRTILRAMVAELAQLIRPSNDDCVDFFGKRYSYLRQFVPGFLSRHNDKIGIIKDIAAAATGICILVWLIVLALEIYEFWPIEISLGVIKR